MTHGDRVDPAEYDYALLLTKDEVRDLHRLVGALDVNDGLDSLYEALSEMVADSNTWDS